MCLFSLWAETVDEKKEEEKDYDRIAVPELD
jgi:hypothetical protein